MTALSAVHSLMGALDRASDRALVEHAVRSWAIEHVAAREVVIELGAQEWPGCGAVEVRGTASSESVLTVAVPSDEPARLMVTCALPAERIDDSLRYTLAVAGRLFGAALARVGRSELAPPEVAPIGRRSPAGGCASLGSSRGAEQLAGMVSRLAQSQVNVLIDGETGVGKTFVARLVHQASPRAREPIRIVNCSAIPESLFESQFFGHERGAFTGATSTRTGVLEAAAAGTIVLDEIGELSLASQAKLLHVLEERRFERIGSNRSIELRARVLCATNRDLDDRVRLGQFRKDLLFRISVVRLNVPPLRERREDLVQLATRILADTTKSVARRITGFTPDALDIIQSYSWPGNVRELRNAIEHAVALGDGSTIGPGDLPPSVQLHAPLVDDPDLVRLPSNLAALERRAIDASLRATKGNRLRAAQLLGVTRQTLYNKLKIHRF